MPLPFDIWPLDELEDANMASPRPFHVFLDKQTMSAELFELPAGGVDTQQPHDWDELYYIISGASQFTANGETRATKTGDTIFVAAQIDHRFHDITEDLKVLVVFSKKDPNEEEET